MSSAEPGLSMLWGLVTGFTASEPWPFGGSTSTCIGGDFQGLHFEWLRVLAWGVCGAAQQLRQCGTAWRGGALCRRTATGAPAAAGVFCHHCETCF